MALIKTVKGIPDMQTQTIRQILLDNLPPYFDAKSIEKEMGMVKIPSDKNIFDFTLSELEGLIDQNPRWCGYFSVQFGLLNFSYRVKDKKITKKEKGDYPANFAVILAIYFEKSLLHFFYSNPTHFVQRIGYLADGEMPEKKYTTSFDEDEDEDEDK